MIAATGHICRYLESIETTHPDYLTVTEPSIKTIIRVISKMTRPRDHHANTYEFPHLIPDLTKE
jgi:hypothetical protein